MGMNISNGSGIKSIQIASVAFLIISAVLIWQIAENYPQIGILQDKIKAQEMVVKDSEDTLKRLKEFIVFTEKNKEIINRFDSILPADEYKPNLLSDLDSLANTNGLSTLKIGFEENIKPANGEKNTAGSLHKNNDFDSRSIKMSLRGSYFSFKNFLSAVEKNLRVMDVVSVDFSADSSSKETEGEKKSYSYNIELKTYLSKPLSGESIDKLLNNENFKNFTVKDLNFTKEKLFNDLFLSPGYNVNTGADEIGNQDIY